MANKKKLKVRISFYPAEQEISEDSGRERMILFYVFELTSSDDPLHPGTDDCAKSVTLYRLRETYGSARRVGRAVS